MTWAWSLPLPATSKLLLMALSDIADDQGVCWPSHKTLASKCTFTDRTVRRLLTHLQTQRLLSVEPRVRKDGSQTSNCYRLAIDAHPPGQIVLGGGHTTPEARSAVTRGVDAGVLPGTTNEPSSNPLPPPPRDIQPGTVVINAGGGSDLCFPKGLTQSQRLALCSRLSALTSMQAQQVLDELAGRMLVTTVRNPLRYCTVLASRVTSATFLPELGLKISDARRITGLQVERLDPAVAKNLSAAKPPKHIREAIERMRAASRDDEG
jgi:hypothetical protein